jgi:hypothetical protein
MERMAVIKQAAQTFDVEKFILRKLNELEIRKQYQIKISNKSAALVNLSDGENINKVWENIKDYVKTSARESLCLCELKQIKPCFDEEFLRFLDQRKQDNMQWLRHPNQRNVDNLTK